MKQSQNIILYIATLITPKIVIPAKAGIQENTGFQVKPGMTNYLKFISSCISLTFVIICIFFGTTLMEPMMVYGQSTKQISISRESGRDPFALPPGARLLSKEKATSGTQEVSSELSSKDISPPSLKINAILISDRIRLASIDRHIVTVGDSIHDEKVLEIKNDRVILGKGDKTRILLLSQSPIQLTVEGK